MRRQLAASLALAAALATTFATTTLAQTGPADPDHPVWKLVQRNESVGGQSYQEWINDYGEWFLFERSPENPPPAAMDDCDRDQPGGDVFFVPHTMIGTTTDYTCTVGADQHLLLFLGGFVDWVDDGETREQALDALYAMQLQYYNFEYTLDGVTVPVGSFLSFQPDFYSFDFAEDNFFELPAGPRDVYLTGAFAMLEPLEPGEHALTVKNTNFDPSLEDPDVLQIDDAVSNLTLTVE